MSALTTPRWVQDAIFYQIFPDRFARSERIPKPNNLEPWDSPPTVHGFKGGDLVGVAEHLDYLEELGVNAIYFNPIFQSAANHRYHTHDYYAVDPILGGNEAFRLLLDRAHTRGIRIMIDGVFNHSSRGFFQFNHILENHQYSPYLDWFHVFEFPINAYDHSQAPQYAAWWNLHGLPKFNTTTPAVRAFLWDVATYWAEFGIDGWRLDVPNEIDDDEFWREFRRRVKGVDSEVYICGEIWGDARRWLQGDQFDSVMNYLFTKLAVGFFIGEEMVPELVSGVGYAPVPVLNARELAQGIERLLSLYPEQVTKVQLNLLSSHDTARFLSIAAGDNTALELATLFQMVYPGAPCIYYGDEIGMMGGKDPGSRAAFPWHDMAEWNQELLVYFQRATALRHAQPALRHGTYRTLYAKDKVYVLERAYQQERLIATFNAGTATVKVTLPLEQGRLVAIFGDLPTVEAEAGKVRISLPPRTGEVWRVEEL